MLRREAWVSVRWRGAGTLRGSGCNRAWLPSTTHTCRLLDEGGVALQDEQEGRRAVSTQVEQDLQHLGRQTHGDSHTGALGPHPSLPPQHHGQELGRPHLELHAARAAVQAVQEVFQEAVAAARGLVGDLWEARVREGLAELGAPAPGPGFRSIRLLRCSEPCVIGTVAFRPLPQLVTM